MQLTEPEAFCVLDHHHRGVGNVYAHFNHRGRHHNVGFAAHKPPHLPFLVFGAHAAVHNADLVLGPRKITAHALVAVH